MPITFVRMTTSFNPRRKPISLESIDRASVRALAEEDTEHLRQAHRAGANVHQTSLDRADQVNEFMLTLNEVDRAAFIRLYQEEMAAARRSMHDKANQSNAQTAARHVKQITRAAQISRAISIVAFTAIAILVMRMFILG